MHDQPIFPDTWDIENKDPFLQNSGISNVSDKIFPKQTGFPQFPVTHDFLSLSTKDIGNKYYNNNIIAEKKDGVTIYTDPDDPTIVLNEVIIDNDRFYKELDNLEIVLFASRNGARLLEQYQRVKAAPNEIVLFLEIDDRTNYFGSVMRIEIGSDVEKMQSLPFREISQFVRSKKVDLSPKEVEDFINNGITSRKNGILKFIMKIFSKTLQATSFIFDGLGTFFEKTIPEKLDFFRISDERWNGEKNLLFFPDSLIESLKNNANTKEQEKAHDKAFTGFYKQIDAIATTAQECADLLKPFFPRLIYNKVKAVIDMITGQITDVKKYMKEHKAVFFDMFIMSIKTVNAMLCGFLNSIVDFVKGIFQIIGIIFKIIAGIYDFADNIGFYTEYIVEIIENFIGAIVSVDYASFFKELINAPAKLYKSISTFLKNGIDLNIDWVSTSYYYGYIVGLIIQTILEIIFTGGTVTAAKLAEYFKAPFAALGKMLQASVSAAKTLLERVLSFIDFIITKLKNPKQLLNDFIKFVEELLIGTKKEAGIGEAVPQEDLLANWNKVAGRGRELGQKLSEVDIKRLIQYLKKLNHELEIFPEIGAFPIRGFSKAEESIGTLNEWVQAAFIYTNTKGKMLIRERATMYEVFHELMHVKHSKSIGLQKYNEMGGIGTKGQLIKEEFVFFKIIDNKDLFTQDELKHALKYINKSIYEKKGINPISFDFDIEKIPLTRKEIKIDKILNIK